MVSNCSLRAFTALAHSWIMAEDISGSIEAVLAEAEVERAGEGLLNGPLTGGGLLGGAFASSKELSLSEWGSLLLGAAAADDVAFVEREKGKLSLGSGAEL